jgi:hypothetical protein
METRAVVLTKMARAREQAEALARSNPDDAPWSRLFELLQSYETMVQDHWPLTSAEKEAGALGWFSVRNIEEVFPDLHTSLSDIAYSLRHSGD